MKQIGIIFIAAITAVIAGDVPEIFSKNARLETKDPWHFSVNAAFNEYRATQDSMEIAYTGNTTNPFGSGSRVSEGSLALLDYPYRPGFEVGFLIDIPYDHWTVGGEFFWYQGTSHIHKYADVPKYYVSPLFIGSSPFIRSLEANWKLHVDVADLYVSRPYYSGEKWKVIPYSGLRGGFIKQTFDIEAGLFNATPTSQSVKMKSNSWGIGPRGGFQTNFLLGAGVSFFGDLATSLLYTRYTKIDAHFLNSLGQSAHATNNRLGTVRPNIDAGLGIEWDSLLAFSSGSYDWQKTFYLNLSASYNFSVYFSQNMGVALVSGVDNLDATPGNLYLQGVSIRVSLVF